MKKRVYSTTEIIAGGTKLKVRQELFRGSNRVPEQVVAATMAARKWMALARPHYLIQQTIDNMQPIFRFCFHSDPTPERRNTVLGVLHTIDAALQRSFAVKVLGGQGETVGYVNRYYSGCIEKVLGVYQYDIDNDLVHHRGEVHLGKDVLPDVDQAAITLIHEFGHKFANLRDHGDAGYFKPDSSGYEGSTLTWQQYMSNADSYALFVYFLANPMIARQRVTGLMREARQGASQSSGGDLGLNNLFS